MNWHCGQRHSEEGILRATLDVVLGCRRKPKFMLLRGLQPGSVVLVAEGFSKQSSFYGHVELPVMSPHESNRTMMSLPFSEVRSLQGSCTQFGRRGQVQVPLGNKAVVIQSLSSQPGGLGP